MVSIPAKKQIINIQARDQHVHPYTPGDALVNSLDIPYFIVHIDLYSLVVLLRELNGRSSLAVTPASYILV